MVKIFHNPTAGDGDHSKKILLKQMKEEGYDCSYSSTKKDGFEEPIPEDTEIIVLAGGDGTVRKLAAHLLEKPLLEKGTPIGLIPAGTANNIAKSLGIRGTHEEIIGRWKNEERKQFDIGRITGLDESPFFLEALGYGVFPRLIKEMKNRKEVSEDPEEELEDALRRLYDIVLDYKPRVATIDIDGVEYAGTFLLVEIMNTPSIGPNLNLNPKADFSDGELEVIMVHDSHRDQLADYVKRRRKKGKNEPFSFKAVKGKKISITWQGALMHVDDQLLKVEKATPIKIEAVQNVLDFYI